MKRRDFLRVAGGGTAAAGGAVAAAAPAAAQTQKPDFGGYISGAKGGTFTDARGSSEVTVDVGGGSSGLAFLPTGLWIDPGTTVTFEWSSNGHNVVPEEQPDGANWEGSGPDLYDEGHSFSTTFETGGIYKYFCQPHKQLGMLGAIAVGDDVPTVSAGGGGEGGEVNPEHMGVPIQAHFVGIATVLMVFVSLVFTFFLLKYGESPHASGGNQ